MVLHISDLDLIIACLNYCHNNKDDFVEHLDYQEHYDTASHCQELNLLRQRFSELFHAMIEKDEKKCRIIVRMN